MNSYKFNPNFLSHSKENLKTILKVKNLLSQWKELSISQITEFLYLLSINRLENLDFIEKSQDLLLRMFNFQIASVELFNIFNTLIKQENIETDISNQYLFFDTLFSDYIPLPFGFKHIDLALDGGLKRNTLNIITSNHGGGKSLLAISISCNLLNHSFHQYANDIKILHLYTDNTKEDIRKRYASNLSNTPISNISNNSDLILENYSDRIKLIDLSKIIFSKSEKKVSDFILSISKEIYPTFRFDLLIIEDIFQIPIIDENSYDQLKNFYQSIRYLSEQCHCAVLFSVQSTKNNSDYSIPFQLAMISSTIIEIEKLECPTEYNLKIKKSRLGVRPDIQHKIHFNQNYLKFHE